MSTANNFTTLFVATSQGLAVSSDNGITFVAKTQQNGLGSLNCQDVFVLNQTVVVGTDNGVSLSTDNGETFKNFSKENTNGNIPSDNCRKVFYTSDNKILVCTDAGASLSPDGGTTWIPITQGNNQLLSNDVRDGVVLGSSIILATALGLSISTDLGSTWTKRMMNILCVGVAISPLGYILIATNKGIYTVDIATLSAFEGPVSAGISDVSSIENIFADSAGVIFVNTPSNAYYSLDNNVSYQMLNFSINGIPIFPTINNIFSAREVTINTSSLGSSASVDTSSWLFNNSSYAANLSLINSNVGISFYSKNNYVPAWVNALISLNGSLIPQSVPMVEINGVYQVSVPALPGSQLVVMFQYEQNGTSVTTNDKITINIPPASYSYIIFGYKDGVNVNILTKLLTNDIPIKVSMNRNGQMIELNEVSFNGDPAYFQYSYPEISGDNSFLFNITFLRNNSNGSYVTPTLEFQDTPFVDYNVTYVQTVNTSVNLQFVFVIPVTSVDIAVLRYNEYGNTPALVNGIRNQDNSYTFTLTDNSGINYIQYQLIEENNGILKESAMQYWKSNSFIPNVYTNVLAPDGTLTTFQLTSNNFWLLNVSATLNGVAVTNLVQDPTTGIYSFGVPNPNTGDPYSVQFTYMVTPSDTPIQASLIIGNYNQTYAPTKR